MRARRILAVAALAVVVAAGGCAPHRVRTEISGGYDAPAARRHAPAPAEPDLATVMERFYQQVEGGHWRFADAMLSPRLRAQLGENGLRSRYETIGNLDVTLRQENARTVVAMLGAKERGGAAHAHRFEETTTLAWDGEDWKIERIARRGVTPAGTR